MKAREAGSWRFGRVLFAVAALAAVAAVACAAPSSAPAAPAGGAQQPAAKPAQPAASAPQPAASAPQAASSAQTYRFRLAYVLSRNAGGGELAVTMAEKAKEKSNGRIIIDIFDNAQLGGEVEVLSSMRTGGVDFAIDGAGVLATLAPSLGILDLPYIFKDSQALHSVLDGPIGQRLLSGLESKGLKALVFGDWGARALLVKPKAVKTVDDLRGLKIRVVESPIYIATWRALGANPTPMAWPEVYTGLQQGTIDATDGQPTGQVDAKQYEVAKYLTLTNHNWGAFVLSMSLQKWQALPPDLQQIIVDAAKEGQKVNYERVTKIIEDAIEAQKKNGVLVTIPDRDAFRAKVQGVHKQFEAQIGADVLSEVLAQQK